MYSFVLPFKPDDSGGVKQEYKHKMITVCNHFGFENPEVRYEIGNIVEAKFIKFRLIQ